MMFRRLPPAALAASSVLLALGLATSASAEDRTDLEGSKIIGNRELPKVLYIVPWKKPVPGEQSAHPPKSVLDEALSPIDREVFRRERSYDAQVHAATATTPAPQTPAGATAPAATTAAPAPR